MDFKFERRKKTRSLSIILAIVVLLLLVIFIPEMLISRSNVIIKYKLDTTSSDTSFVRLAEAAYSYLETADMFVIFGMQTDKARAKLAKKINQRFLQECSQASSDDFCQVWKKILTEKQLKQCDKCTEK